VQKKDNLEEKRIVKYQILLFNWIIEGPESSGTATSSTPKTVYI
jgi:hypothetical protein